MQAGSGLSISNLVVVTGFVVVVVVVFVVVVVVVVVVVDVVIFSVVVMLIILVELFQWIRFFTLLLVLRFTSVMLPPPVSKETLLQPFSVLVVCTSITLTPWPKGFSVMYYLCLIFLASFNFDVATAKKVQNQITVSLLLQESITSTRQCHLVESP